MYPDKWLIEWTAANGQVARETAQNDVVCEGILLRLKGTLESFDSVRVILIESISAGAQWLYVYGTR